MWIFSLSCRVLFYLFIILGGQDLIEVGHPAPPEGVEDPRVRGAPVLHMGPVAAGKLVAQDDQLRQDFAAKVIHLSIYLQCSFYRIERIT